MPVRRSRPNKRTSAKKFNADSHKTKKANLPTAPMRGGIRF